MTVAAAAPRAMLHGRPDYNDDIIRQFAIATVVWALIGMLAGVFLASELSSSISINI